MLFSSTISWEVMAKTMWTIKLAYLWKVITPAKKTKDTKYSTLFCNKAIILVFFQMHYNFSLLFLLRQNMPNSQLVHEKITPTVKLNLVAVNVLIKDTNYILCCTSLKYIFSLLMVLLQSESPSGISTKLHTAAASNNKDHPTRSLSYCLFTLHIYVCCS